MTVANQKGGVGKTTTAINFAAALGELGWRVAIIDLDPQGNATTGVGLAPEKVELSTYDVLLHDAELGECIVPTAYDNVSIAPATVDLAGAEVELVPLEGRENRLRMAIESLGDRFEYVIIDCPPSLGLLTINAFVAAREVMVPILCEYYALEGVGQLVQNTELVKASLNSELEISAVLLTMYDARTKLSSMVEKDVKAYFGERVCNAVIPRSVRLSEAPSFGQPITAFDPLSRGAQAYRELAEEISGGKA
jgi:chromosome partitioning protein